MLFSINKFSKKVENIYRKKSIGLTARHYKEEQELLNEISKRGAIRSSAVYSSSLDLYIRQATEHIEIFYSSIIEVINNEERISFFKRRQYIHSIKTFINDQFEIKKTQLMKRITVGGLSNSPLSIPYLSKLEDNRIDLLDIYTENINININKINKNSKWYNSLCVKVVSVLSGIWLLIQIFESETFINILISFKDILASRKLF